MEWFKGELFEKLRAERGVTWGSQVHILTSVGSTNDEALSAIAAGAKSGAVWVAREQTQGRGRRGNSWHAPPGESLVLSTLLRFRGEPERIMGLSLVVGLALRAVIAERLEQARGEEAPEVQIKWPNDVFVEGKKIAGILIETRSGADGELGIVIGVGLNVLVAAFPAELPPATSLRLLGVDESACHFEALVVDFLSALETKLTAFLAQDFSPFLPELATADYLHEKRVRVGTVEGIASGFDSAGRLLLGDERGITTAVISGNVEILS